MSRVPYDLNFLCEASRKKQTNNPSLIKKLAWWLLVLVVLLIGVWLCWLAYYAWSIAMDSVGELPDLPRKYPFFK